MNQIYKIITYIAISLLASYLVRIGNAEFFNAFKNNIIGLLATLLAINITASALISAELTKLKTKHPDSDIQESNLSLKKTFVYQIVALLMLFVILLLRDYFSANNLIKADCVQLVANAFIIGVFAYYIETIYDLGCALYNILQFNSKDSNKD